MTCNYIFVLVMCLVGVSGFRFRCNTKVEPFTNQYHNPSLISGFVQSIRGGEVQVITSLEEVEAIIDETSIQNQLVVLDFTANNCPPCEMIAPIYHELSELEEFTSVKFLKVNVNDCPDVAERYAVDGWPTFLLFKKGERVDSIVGGQLAKAGLYSLIAKYL